MTSYPATCEYRDIPADAPRSTCTVLVSAPSRTHPNRVIRLERISAGYACAGSMARWDNECWAVRFDMGGAVHGRRCKREEDARSLFAQWTGTQA